MSRYYDRCPKCGRDFDDCPHSLADIEEMLADRVLQQKVEKIVNKALAGKEQPK